MLLQSPAKINFGLKIIGKRDDGYHLLKTILCLINLYDQIEITINNSDEINLIDHTQSWSKENDLTYKAAMLLKNHLLKHHKALYGVNIKIHKNIPIGAGLGGGSSNAATVLVGLNQLWQANLSQTQLLQLGQQLGADVPFFIYGKNAFATGIGEQLTPVAIPKQYLLLIKPKFSLATKDVFNATNVDFNKIDSQNISQEYLINTKDNDLYQAAIKINPQLQIIFDDLKQYGEPIMSGSGSAVYLTFPNESDAKKVAHLLQNSYNPLLVNTLGVSPLYQQTTL